MFSRQWSTNMLDPFDIVLVPVILQTGYGETGKGRGNKTRSESPNIGCRRKLGYRKLVDYTYVQFDNRKLFDYVLL